MSRYHSYLSTASKLIETYERGLPFAPHLKKFFAGDKKYGSRDRRMISALCYNYFRVSLALNKQLSISEKIIAAFFIFEKESTECLKVLNSDLNDKITFNLSDKLALYQITPESLFPFTDELSAAIHPASYGLSFTRQPSVFVRIRPERKTKVVEALNAAGVLFNEEEEYCLRLMGNPSLDDTLRINKDVVVQDCNSQKVFDYIKGNNHFFHDSHSVTVWDCCAASGGKAILLFDILKKKIKLSVSDIRKNILLNLSTRLQQASINIYKSFTSDLSKSSGLGGEEKFEMVVCDVPCTGSGTWSRSPEQLFSFNSKNINFFVERQQAIVSNTIPHVEEKGLFYYITCSVFKKENEDMVAYIKKKHHLELLHMQYLEGSEIGADTMFVAVFKK